MSMSVTATGPTASSAVEQREDLVTLTIDDIEVSVPKGTLVIRAAELIGVEVPRFCDHPLLDPVGACRQCLVEVPDGGTRRPIPKPQASCTLEVAPGMKIKTQVTSPIADKAQRGNMEFLLINHPLDCPICDKGGECPLQNQAMSHGYAESRFTDEKRTYPKPINISPNVLLDRERCVLCARCTRFSEQIAGDPFIALIERGALQQVGIYEKEPFESYFSGNTIQICPVGALTSAEYRFRSRPFDLVSTPSIAEHDACGSAIRVDHRRGKVMRRLAGDDPDVNEEWITDKDRFAIRYGDGEDRLTRPLVRDGAVLRPASWPEAIDVAVRGLQAAGNSVGVLTGGRLTLEDAYSYSKFARAVLGTNNIDFRARQHSSEEADFLAHAVAGTGRGVSFTDLENASSVLLVCLEPEEEAGMIFLRIRKAFRKKHLISWTLAPYASNGARKMGAQHIPCVPGDEPAILDRIDAEGRAGDDRPAEITLDANSVILVGERAAGLSGTFSACLRLAERTGARLAWVPRRAGDRGAVDAGCLPNLLPGGRPVSDAAARVDTQTTWGVESLPSLEGRDADEILIAAADGELEALVVAGVDPKDFVDPQAALEGLEKVTFVISLETRASSVTERANVVFPVSLMYERAGTFVNWEGRRRSFDMVIDRPDDMSDLRVLAALADALGTDLGFRTAAQARAELDELGSWEGERTDAPDYPAGEPAEPGSGTALLATWRMALDESRALDGEPYLQATARAPEARMSPNTAADAGITSVAMISNDRGSITMPAVVDSEMIDGVVWLPSRAPGRGIPQHLAASAGDLVTIGRPPEPVMSAEPGMSAEPVTPAEPGMPAEPVTPAEPVEAPPSTDSMAGVDDDTEARR
jgi:NADH-quinone oxidoreductase subunit G